MRESILEEAPELAPQGGAGADAGRERAERGGRRQSGCSSLMRSEWGGREQSSKAEHGAVSWCQVNARGGGGPSNRTRAVETRHRITSCTEKAAPTPAPGECLLREHLSPTHRTAVLTRGEENRRAVLHTWRVLVW